MHRRAVLGTLGAATLGAGLAGCARELVQAGHWGGAKLSHLAS